MIDPFVYSENATFSDIAGPISPSSYRWFFYVLYVLGSIHLFFSLWMVAEYFLLNWHNFVLPSFVYSNKLVSVIRRYSMP